MCGLTGYVSIQGTREHADELCNLFIESAIRGTHAYGLAYYDDFEDDVITLKDHDLQVIARRVRQLAAHDIITHTRYSQSGDWRNHHNNQPLSIEGYTLVFNGVISMGTQEEMEQEYGWKLSTYNDGELLIRHMLDGGDPVDFVKDKGSFAGLWFGPDGYVYALRNERRPLWYLRRNHHIYAASTRDIIRRALGIEAANAAQEFEPNVVYGLWEMINEPAF